MAWASVVKSEAKDTPRNGSAVPKGDASPAEAPVDDAAAAPQRQRQEAEEGQAEVKAKVEAPAAPPKPAWNRPLPPPTDVPAPLEGAGASWPTLGETKDIPAKKKSTGGEQSVSPPTAKVRVGGGRELGAPPVARDRAARSQALPCVQADKAARPAAEGEAPGPAEARPDKPRTADAPRRPASSKGARLQSVQPVGDRSPPGQPRGGQGSKREGGPPALGPQAAAAAPFRGGRGRGSGPHGAWSAPQSLFRSSPSPGSPSARR